MKKVLIEMPDDHKRVIDNLVEDGKGYLLPYEVENRMALAIRNGKVLSEMTNGDLLLELLAGQHDKIHPVGNTRMGIILDSDWWNAPYQKEVEECTKVQ